MKPIRMEVAELGVASRTTEANTTAVVSDPTGVSWGQVCTPIILCKSSSAD